MSRSEPNQSNVIPYDVASLFKKWERIGMDMPTNKWVYNIRDHEIRTWIEQQPVYMWKFYDIDNTDHRLVFSLASIGQSYVFTDEMEVWFELRWR